MPNRQTASWQMQKSKAREVAANILARLAAQAKEPKLLPNG
jgi:hypothetical protein